CFCLCDTTGDFFPDEIAKLTEIFRKHLDAAGFKGELGFHGHNDFDSVIANSIAVAPYVDHIQGTFGEGERVGNANLAIVIPLLVDRLNYFVNVKHPEKTRQTVLDAYKILGLVFDEKTPIIGKYAATNKAGMHTDGHRKGAKYIVFDTAKWGNPEEKYHLSDQMGTGDVVEFLKEFGIEKTKDDAIVADMTSYIKDKCAQGYTNWTAAEKFLLFQHYFGKKYSDVIKSISFEGTTIVVEGKEEKSRVVWHGFIFGHHETVVNDITGSGIFAALFEGLKKELDLITANPLSKDIKCTKVADIRIVDYNVDLVDNLGYQSTVRVTVTYGNDNGELWTVVGCDKNKENADKIVIEKGFAYRLLK
ncbi:MAG: hypothetical protein Q8O89_02550, partial [Nanoarchaeota archaeon]|nr:hypothetical protein [Nanoarchaeota archaeon]